MTDPMDAIFNVLEWNAKLRPHNMSAVVPRTPKTIAVSCSCGLWDMESAGTDQSSRNYIHAAHRAHVTEATR